MASLSRRACIRARHKRHRGGRGQGGTAPHLCWQGWGSSVPYTRTEGGLTRHSLRQNGPTMTLPPSTPRAIAAPVAAPALPETTERALPRYVQIAMRMADLIDSGAFKAGQRLPSVRDTATQEGVAISTTVQAFRWLEERGLVQARPKAGYFVAPRRRGLALPSVSKPPNRSLPVDRESRSGLILAQNPDGQGVSFGGAFPKDQTFFQDDRIRVALGRATRIHRRSLIEYDTSGSCQAICRQKRSAQRGFLGIGAASGVSGLR